MLIAKHMLLEYPGDYHLEGADMSGTDLREAKLESIPQQGISVPLLWNALLFDTYRDNLLAL